jgi:hypothetical protein
MALVDSVHSSFNATLVLRVKKNLGLVTSRLEEFLIVASVVYNNNSVLLRASYCNINVAHLL